MNRKVRIVDIRTGKEKIEEGNIKKIRIDRDGLANLDELNAIIEKKRQELTK